MTDFRPYCGGPSYPSVEAFSSGCPLDRGVMEWFTRQYLSSARARRAFDSVVELLRRQLR